MYLMHSNILVFLIKVRFSCILLNFFLNPDFMYAPVLSPRNFIVLPFIFRSTILPGTDFLIDGVRQGSS